MLHSLCTIHIVRSFFKKITELFGKVFFNQSKILKDLWKILQGIFYLESNYLINLVHHMRYELLPILPADQFCFYFYYYEISDYV